MSDEAFVYLWFDAKNRMFYLGSHKGHPEDNYTHSSSIMEAFIKSDIPVYMRRRILATGTHESMKQLEVDLLNNRKACLRRWDKYYNVIAHFPPPPIRGKENFFYIDGRSSEPDWNKKRQERYRKKNPEKIRRYKKKYDEENRERTREYRKNYDEKNREKERERKKKWHEENRDYLRKWREENCEKLREYGRNYREKNREKIREHKRKYYAKKKAEKMGTSTLEDFLNEA